MNQVDSATVLAGCGTLANVTPEVLALVAERCTRKRFAAGDLLLRQGDVGDSLLILVEGHATATVHDGEGKQHALGAFGPGNLLGEMALVTDEKRMADVVANQDGEALVLSTEAFDELVGRHPELGIVLTHLVAARLGEGETDGLGGKVVGGYRIRRCLGRGATAIVYEAEHVDTRGRVALKMLSHHLIYEHGATVRFQREAEVLAGLSHPNIVRVSRRFQAYRTWFLVMELCDGADLETLSLNGYRPDDLETRAIIGQLAAGLAYLHARGVLHRDVKPQNVLVTRDGVLRLTDFGLARAGVPRQSDALTLPGTVLGTPLYMAPEQMYGEDATPASDVYGLGATVLHLLTGSFPFLGPSLTHIAELKLRPSLPPRRQLGRRRMWRGLSRTVHRLLRTCLQPDPADRRVDLAQLAEWSRPVALPPACFQGDAALASPQRQP
ncbi:MAG: protein kinase [Planctomycetota bacterium]